MTDIVVAETVAEVVFRGSDDAFSSLLKELEVDELMDVGLVLTKMSNTSAVRAGLTAYEIRQSTPDGEWGQQVYKLAELWEVSDRTISRWMRAAQDHFQLELTPAQKNAQVPSRPDEPSSEEAPQSEAFEWDDEDDDAGFAALDDDDSTLTERMNAEAGWGDDTLPSAEYRNEDASAAVKPKPMALPPDDTWVEFTAKSIMQEHDGYAPEAAERSARARWARKLEEDPMDLLEELEMIHESQGGSVPDASIEALLAAEEERTAIKPDAVTEGKPKKVKSTKFAYDVAEKLLTMSRQLHEQVYKGLKDGTMDDKQAAAMLPHLEGIPRTISGLSRMAKEAKERYLKENPPMEAKIAATVEAETEMPDFESEL